MGLIVDKKNQNLQNIMLDSDIQFQTSSTEFSNTKSPPVTRKMTDLYKSQVLKTEQIEDNIKLCDPEGSTQMVKKYSKLWWLILIYVN